MDPIFRSSYQLNPNVAILYVGFDEGGVYRRYPGTGDSRNQTAYDPRVRPWYKDAQANPTSAYVVTDPYRDAFGQGWEITVSSLIRNTSSGAIIGVAGVDVVIDTLKATLESQAAKGGSMSLYQTNGVALSNPSWNLKTWTADVPFTYRNATNPTINADLWDRMRSASSGVASSEVYKDPSSGDNYLVVYKVLNITNGKLSPSYVSVSAFPMALVNIPVQNVQARMNNILATYSGISVGIFLAVLIIVSTSVAILANSAAQPLVRLSHESEKISRNIGENDLFAGVDPTNGGGKGIALARIDETEELSQRFYSMIETLRATTKAPAGKANPFYKNSEMPDWNSNVHSKNVVDKVPDLPPPSYEAAESPESGTPGSAA
ncbi:hypothetical protein M427DRAFT_231039 [Gonapodya prolifera JEL478]|uniref:Uncharacterized protein n=1 Tax=Gonapodya prolifera (strain JEL478) TaxID=1344416 RepID=A0A138ZYR3_GONPJ|nr:hypothetical protein M427DRAFT_231039 [Gonapodya prolifera JEL478]|eukprot:KXS09415.1 hypothetical protein M427DRAFT_231039 [Gonapodya prolifera JEL478]